MRYFSFITHAPSFADEDKRRIATILHFILIVTTIANIATILVRPFLLAGQALGPVSANIVILLLQIALFVLMRKGYVRLAGFTLTLFIWTLLSLEAYANNGILNPFFCIQTIVIVIAALLINEWAALGFAVLSSVFGLWLVQLADAGKYVGAVGAITTQVTWMSDTTAFVLTALLFYMRIRSIREVEKRIVEQGRSRQHSDERYRSLVENAPDTIFTLDRNHKITYMNRSTMASVETLIGQSVYDFLHPNSRDAYRAAVNRVLELGSTEQIEVQNLRPGEQSAWYAIRFAPVYEDGQVVEVTAISTNITEQKHVQEALRASEEQYRQLFEANPHPMFVVNLEAGKFLAVNDAAVNQYGYSREEFLTMIVTALRVEEASTIMKQADDLRQQEPSHQSGGIVQHRKKDGSVIWVEMSYHRLNYNGHDAVVSAAHDLTKRLQVEEALRASEEQYRQLFEDNPHPMFVSDAETREMLGVNDAALAMYGYSREEFVGMKTVSLLHPDDYRGATERLQRSKRENLPFIPSTINRFIKKDGSVISVEAVGHQLSYQGRKAILTVAYDLTERLKVEDALRESEARLRARIESAMDAIITIDESQQIVQFNPAAEKMFQVSADDIIGQPIIKLIPERFRPIHGDHIRAFGEAGVTNRRMGALGAISGLRANGEEFPIEASISQFDVGTGKFYSVILRDITERLRAEQALRESEARLKARIESAMDAIITIDESQHIVQFNPAAEKMFQVSADDIIGQPIIKLIPERFRPIHGDHIRAFGEAGVTNRRMGALGAISGLRANGEEFPIEASISQFDVGTGKFYSVILRDITERKRAEDEIRRSEELFSTIFQSVPVTIGIVSLVSNQTLAVNDYMVKLTGYETYEFIGRPVAEAPYWVQPDQWQKLSQPIREGEATSGVEMQWRTQSGQMLTMLGSAIQVDINGEPCLLGLALDITERKQAERMRLEVYRERELLEVKEHFISRMSHDFRTPLAVVLTANQLLRHYYDRMAPERREELFQNVENQVQFVIKLLDDVLTLSKERAGKMPFKPAPINLVSTCEGLFLQMQTLDSAHHEFIFVTDGEIGEIQGDEKLLQHIFVNLLSNAIKYSPENSEVRFEVRREGDSAVIAISDQGIGIPEEDQKHLFEPFYRASNTGSINGTGLGLAIVKESVETHYGTIHCESAPNQGTTFIVHLPIVPSV